MEHLQHGEVGTANAKCEWIRSVFLMGYEVGIFTLEEGIIESALAASEALWMNKFKNLTNQNLYRKAAASDLGTKIGKRIKKSVPNVTYNFRGYHGVSYSRDKGAFTLRMSFGQINGRCCSYLLRGEDSLGNLLFETQAIWFSSLTETLNARTRHRRELRNNELFEQCCPPGWDWPCDKA